MAKFDGANVEDYGRIAEVLDPFGQSLCGLLKQIALNSGIRVHRIVYRVKAYESAAAKLAKSPDRYTGIEALTDMLGVRVITYFADEVDAIAELVEREFAVDLENSVDKRALLDPDRFGYLSRHYILSLNSAREGLPEYSRFKGEIFELQIRSILQHAWAEVEHDLGYKSQASLPNGMKRQFSRLAGLLELADEQFADLRDRSVQYSRRVKADIALHPESLGIDQITVGNFVIGNDLLHSLDSQLAVMMKPTVLEEERNEPYDAHQASNLIAVGIRNLEQLAEELESNSSLILDFGREWIGPEGAKAKSVPRGVSLYYLVMVKVAQMGEAEARRAIESSKLPGSEWLGEKNLLSRAFAKYERVMEKRAEENS
ncbi:GTP pyrophosphokinase family protein [Streptomyces sp. NPDC048201]|uniref:GTP pyrophosphokinase n=1 Tax=Streptomyces sp. NPDC048201 TaxID=3365513 RepID=UPI0037208733